MARSRKPRPRRPYRHPEARWSERIYVRVEKSKIALFRFFLEAHDNLGLFTMADRAESILMVRYSPHQKREMAEFLDGVKEELGVEVVFEGLGSSLT